MSKKLMVYGLAFGSAAAALSYIYMIGIAGKAPLWVHLISIFGEFLLIPGIAIYLFLRNLRTYKPEEFVLGRAIFMSFFLSVMISASVSLFYSYMAEYHADVINGFVEMKIKQLRGNPNISKLTEKELNDNIGQIRDSYSISGQLRYQLYLGAARGLFLGAIIAYFMKAKSSAA